MSPNDPLAACDRLVALLERVLSVQEKVRRTTDDTISAPVVRYVISQLRMRIGPAFASGWPALDAVHLVLCGGTNTGKSTVLNLLLGRPAAPMGVRARLSQHPEAYRPASLGDSFLDAFPTRFASYRRFREEHPPRQSDDELRSAGYKPALAVLDPERLPAPAQAPAVAGAVLWDAPDFSTEEAQIYLGSVLDLAALADVVVLTVTDESYADDRGHALLRMMSDSGVRLLVLANKIPDDPALFADLSRTMTAGGNDRAPALRLPRVRGASPEQRLANLLATSEAMDFRRAVEVEVARGRELKRRGLKGAVALIERHWDELVRPLAAEAELGERWGLAVDRATQDYVLAPYRRDYLEGLRYGEFNKALVQLMGLLQVPGIGPLMTFIGRAVRLPFRLVTASVRRLRHPSRTEHKVPPERAILDEAVQRWLSALRAEAQTRVETDPHPVWAEVVRKIDSKDFREGLLASFGAGYSDYQIKLDALVRERAEKIYRKLRREPKKLNALRGANLLGNVFSVALAIKSWGLDWSDAVLGPVVAGLWHNLVEWGLGRYMETQRAGLKRQQYHALEGLVATDLVRPAGDVFQGRISAEDLNGARRDFAVVAESARRLVEEDDS